MRHCILIIALTLFLKCNLIQTFNPSTLITGINPEDALLNFTGLARKYGHPAEIYHVETQDGYILELYHLPGTGRKPILLMHGFLDSSDTWILRGKDSLGISLADNGYDVWLGNTRGNRYSSSHISLDPQKNPEYWMYSIHELGYYDLPAIIDEVLLRTGAQSLTAIGHSQGNTIFYILGSTRPEYNAKINLLIALSPICFMHNTSPPVSTYLKLAPKLAKIARRMGIYDLLRYDGPENKFIRKICSQPIIGYAVCARLFIFPLIGFDPTELEYEFYEVLIHHLPAGTSWMNYEHFGQIGMSKRFARYDYGIKGNVIKYNSTIPPLYELSNVTMPIALLGGRNDPLSTLEDVDLLKDHLPNYVEYLVNPRLQFNHGDSVWGKNMKDYLFRYIYSTLEWYDIYP
ncbi:jg7247 [Pararge aegeria aegeria]|uniref:Lipase n=1 Tax=Pararge aegeria aegeria TaxID=348720 RepID=A0A8S4SGL0_9NEOP|nr:jg7247 [Pararge aegeria aegeria]